MDNDQTVLSRWWKNTTIRSKIQYSLSAFALVVLLVTTISLTITANGYFQRSNYRELSLLAQVLAENSKATLAFGDKESATNILSAIEKNPDIATAAIYKSGMLFAVYPDNVEVESFDLNKLRQGTWRNDQEYFASSPIKVNNKDIGWLALNANFNSWQLFWKNLLGAMIGVLASIALLTYFTSYWLKKHVIVPLKALSVWATSVYKNKNFSARATKHGDDEIGQLADSLNAMLAELSKQESIISLNSELEDEIKVRKETELQLISMRDQAENANRSKSDFLANMSHEIRTPMNSIIGFADLLLEESLSELQRKHLMTVRSSAQDLHSLLNDILDVAKLEEGKLQLESVAFSVKELVVQVMKTFELKAQEKDLQMIQRVSDNLAEHYLGDALRLKQVLINLIGNSIKFTASGSIMVAVEQLDEHQLQFIIRDTGIGIAKDKLDKIFESFSQADTSTSRRFGGTGLGTTISKRLIELMNGKIWVESNEGVGSTFYFTVHLERTEQQAETKEFNIDSQLLRSDKSLDILVAEDGEQNAELLRIRLEGLGHNVVRAINGEEAVKLFSEQVFDIVLMDIQMPVMDGLQAAEQIRSLPEQQYVPIIALTASVMHEDRKACFAVGMDGFVKKPVVFNELFTEMSKLLHHKFNSSAERLVVNKQQTSSEVTYINFEQGVSTWASAEVYTKNLKQFARIHQLDMNTLKHNIAQADLEAAEHLVHALKGTAGNLALIDLYDELLIMNGYLKRNDQSAAHEHIKILTNTFNASMAAIARLEDGKSEPLCTRAIDFDELKVLIEHQVICLADGRLEDDSLQIVINKIQCLDFPKEQIEQLINAVDSFELALAADTLSELLSGLKSMEKRHG